MVTIQAIDTTTNLIIDSPAFLDSIFLYINFFFLRKTVRAWSMSYGHLVIILMRF